MGVIKNIAVDSLTYGSVTILARLLSYVMVYFHVRWLTVGDYGTFSQFYSLIAVLNVVYVLSMETSFFRFVNAVSDDRNKIGNMQTLLIGWSLLLSLILWLFAESISLRLVGRIDYGIYVRYMAVIMFIDSISSIPYVWLRYERRKKIYVMLKAFSIVVNIALQFFFIYATGIKETFHLTNLQSIFLANIFSSLFVGVILLRYTTVSFRLDVAFLKQLLYFSLPLTIAGLGGVVNDMSDRIMIPFLASPDKDLAERANGIYAANYKISILLVLFTQAYRLGAEPFLFKIFKSDKESPKMYAKLMNVFVLLGCFICLGVVLFLHLWKHIIVSRVHPEYEEGLWVTPILVFANLLLGMYFSCSIWFKLTNKTSYGMMITLFVSVLTVVLNYLFIPMYGYWAAAWITLLSYLLMVVATYWLGIRHYPIPYALGKIAFYFLMSVGLSLLYIFVLYDRLADAPIVLTMLSVAILLLFVVAVWWRHGWKWKAIVG